MPKFEVTAETRVNRTYIVEAKDDQEAFHKVDDLLASGNYDDTDVARWQSSGASVVLIERAQDQSAQVDSEFAI